MRLCFLLLLFLLLLQSLTFSQSYIDTAFSYVGVHEKTGRNDGVEVERFLKSVGRKKGDSWCAAFVSYCLTSANHSFPVRSGLARNFVIKKSILATQVLSGPKHVEIGDLIIWQKGTTISGHIGFVIEAANNKFLTIEGNTSSRLKGSQADGDGVYIKKRTIQPYNYFRVKWFTKLGGC